MTSKHLFQKTFILRRSGVAIFADIIKIVSMFIKTIFKYSRIVKRIRSYASNCSLYLYFLIKQNLLISSENDLRGGYNSNNFSLLDEKGPSVKIQLLNMFKDHHFVVKPSHIAVGFGEWLSFNALWLKFYNSHGKYRPELNEYFHMYEYQLTFTMFCGTSALGISWEPLNHPDLILLSVYRFHAYFYVRLILHHLGISLPYEDSFSKVKSPSIKSAYYSICDDYGVNSDKTWMHGNWFYTTSYGIFGDRRKATKRSPPDNLKQWIITQPNGFTRKCVEKISRSEGQISIYSFLLRLGQDQV